MKDRSDDPSHHEQTLLPRRSMMPDFGLIWKVLFQIIGSSLLIMYDKHDKSGVWMIDFAKTIPVEAGMVLNHRSPWQLGNHEDGYLSGVDSLIEVFYLFYLFIYLFIYLF